MSNRLTFETDDKVAIITLDDGKANAMGFDMLEALNDAIDQAERDCAAVVLLGRPGVLSGGFDLKVINGGDDGEIDRMINLGVRTMMRLYGLSIPLVAVATGHAVALGAFILLASDYRFGCAGDFKVGLNETAIGLTFPAFGIELAQARLSPRFLTQSAISARLFSPDEAVEVGFLDAVVAAERLRDDAVRHAHEMSALDAHAFNVTKQAFRGAAIERVLSGLAA
jgi:enoyl-CoA hydratase